MLLDIYSSSSPVQITKPVIEIELGTTWFAVECDILGKLPCGLNIGRFVAANLVQKDYDPRLQIWKTQYNYTTYDKERNRALFPRYALNEFITYLGEDYEVQLKDVPPISAPDIKLSMKKGFQLREHQGELFDFLISDGSYKPLGVACGGGKALRNSELIKVPGGWKRMGDIRVGDKVIARDGTATTVTGVYPQGIQRLWCVGFEDGRTLLCTDEHLWTVTLARSWQRTGCKARQFVMTTRELMAEFAKPCNRGRIHIPLINSEQSPDIELPLDPYVLGVLIGDGSISDGTIQLTTDKWIINEVLRRLGPCFEAHTVNNNVYSVDYCEEVRIVYNGPGNPLKDTLKSLGLMGKRSWEKFIPEIYLEGSTEQRMELIRGLMDTDGYISNPKKQHGRNGAPSKCGSPEFSTTSEVLANQFRRLIWSVGGTCRCRSKTPMFTYKGEYKAGKTAYIVRFRVKHLDEFVSLPRKKNMTTHENQYTHKLKLRVTGVYPTTMQEPCTCISVDHPEQLYVAGDYIATHNTVLSLAAVCYHKKAAFIVLGFLIDQWYKNIRQFTTVRRDDIFVIKGFDSLKNLWEMLHNGFKPKIVICSTRTLMLYAVDRKSPYDNLPTYQELLEALGIGTLVHDEVHLNFYANTQIDLRTNVMHNIFLSATYMRSDFQGKRIFHLVFPKEMIFGGSEIKKYTKVMVMSYDLGIPDAAIVKFKVLKGYLHAKYESFLLRNKRYFDRFISEVLQRLIDQFYIPVRKPEQKLLILCQTKLFVMHTVDTLKKLYPDLSPVPYFSGDSTYGKARMLEHKIIVSTIKSSSTGLDIKNLKVCINTVSFSSEPQAAQCMGRLRQLPDEDTIYVDIYNREVPSQCYHIQNRKKAYRDRALSIEESSYN